MGFIDRGYVQLGRQWHPQEVYNIKVSRLYLIVLSRTLRRIDLESCLILSAKINGAPTMAGSRVGFWEFKDG